MASSPSKSKFPHLPPQSSNASLPPSAPQGHRSIRRLQSAHALSSTTNSSNSPSLITLQRQQQQQQQGQHPPQQRSQTGSQKDREWNSAPPVPRVPSHGRSRSNSDAVVLSMSEHGSSPRRNAVAKRIVGAGSSGSRQATLDGLLRDGPFNGDLKTGLRDMRYLVLTDGVLSDNDGMVCKICMLSSLLHADWSIVISPDLRLAHLAMCSSSSNG